MNINNNWSTNLLLVVLNIKVAIKANVKAYPIGTKSRNKANTHRNIIRLSTISDSKNLSIFDFNVLVLF